MQKFTLYIVSCVAGLIFILLLNASPLSRLGFGIQLPIGWQNAPIYLFHNCTLEEGSDPNKNHCSVPCPDTIRHNQGIPFAFNRSNETNHCLSDYNEFAIMMNVFVGAATGILYIFIVNKRWPN